MERVNRKIRRSGRMRMDPNFNVTSLHEGLRRLSLPPPSPF
jgi:hypothetical protein